MSATAGSGRVWVARLALAALVTACGGRSQRTTSEGGAATGGASGATGGASGGSTPSNGGTSGSQSPTSFGGHSGVPSLGMIDDDCNALCQLGVEARCNGYNLVACVHDCTSAGELAYYSYGCITTFYDFLNCVGGLSDICAVLSGGGDAPMPCPSLAAEVLTCNEDLCHDHPEIEACP